MERRAFLALLVVVGMITLAAVLPFRWRWSEAYRTRCFAAPVAPYVAPLNPETWTCTRYGVWIHRGA